MGTDNANRTANLARLRSMNPPIYTPDLDGYFDWVVEDLKWGTLVDDLASEAEARELSSRTGGGAVYRRSWKRVE